MKKIALTKGKFAIVDDEDFEWLNQWKWYSSDNGYATRRVYIKNSGRKNQKCYTIKMHRLINNTPNNLFTDHINQDKLDNRRHNLRTVDKSLNGINREKQQNNTSGYKGISWHKKANKWMVEICVKGKKNYLGLYSSIKDAITARKKGEGVYHGTV